MKPRHRDVGQHQHQPQRRTLPNRQRPRLHCTHLELLESRRMLAASQVAASYLFYDQSSFDGNQAGPNLLDAAAIAVDKVPFRGNGVSPVASHVTSYFRGINGLMVDLDDAGPGLSLADFQFRVGDSPTAWDTWPAAPQPTGFSLTAGAGMNGSDRVTLTWPSGSITNQWLAVTVRAGSNTGLSTADTFMFGSRVGDAFNDLTPTVFITNVNDEIAARNGTTFGVGIDHPLDFDRNGIVNVNDQIIARNNLGFLPRQAWTLPPLELDVALQNDTGIPDDQLTNDPTLLVEVSPAASVAQLWASVNGQPAVDIAASLVGNSLLIDAGIYQLLTGAPLPDGQHAVELEVIDSTGRNTIAEYSFTLDTVAPSVSLSSAVTITNDLTPLLTATAFDGGVPLENVLIDVDLDYDGSFLGLGELGYGAAELFNGLGYFELHPALPPDLNGSAYYVQLRARATDAAGNVAVSAPISLKIDTIGNSILADYVNTPDPSYGYTLANTINGGFYTAYVLDLKSQTWLSAAEVSKPTWQHWLQIIVPHSATPPSNTALMLISGGSTQGSPPASVDMNLVGIAVQTNSVVVVLPTVPNQPLVFTGDGQNRTEDAIIAYTFRQYMDNLGEPGNEIWPALLPMVKSAVAAMDATQSFLPSVNPSLQIEDFVVTGYSKRGWTTWLTAAVDDRVRAIVPGVIDFLNVDAQMKHHYEFYGGFAPAINDYVGFNVIQESFTDAGQELGRVIDPYSYLNNGRFDDMPKLLINASGDEFFVPDSAQFYFNDIPGTQNYLRYVPNSGHGVNSLIAGQSTAAFFSAVIHNIPLPEFSWTVRSDGQIIVDSTTAPTQVLVWRATNPVARDFRNAYTSLTWTSTPVAPSPDGLYRADAIMPPSGAHAFFVELTFPPPLVGMPNHVFTTQIVVVDSLPKQPWPYYMPTNPPPGAPLAEPAHALDSNDAPSAFATNAVSFAIAVSGEAFLMPEALFVPATGVASVAPPPAPLAPPQSQHAPRIIDQVVAEWGDESPEILLVELEL